MVASSRQEKAHNKSTCRGPGRAADGEWLLLRLALVVLLAHRLEHVEQF